MVMKRIYKIMLITIILNVVCSISIANTNGNLIIEEAEFSSEYEKWLELSDEEKEDSAMPSMYTINLDNGYSLEAGANEENLPTHYNTADYINIKVRNQGITNSCWAITSNELFEILYAKKNNLSSTISFSERHVDYSCSNVFANNVVNLNGFNRKVGSGGRFEYALAYYASGKGPIRSEEMPFENNSDIIDISEIQNKTVQSQVCDYTEYANICKEYDEFNNIISYTNGENDEKKLVTYTEEQIEKFRNIIKKQIKENGAVGTYTYYKSSDSFFSKEDGYVWGNSYFCNSPSASKNHAVCIVGWDDNYSKTNFKEECRPVHDGAYIALNSWGTEWNSGKGYYYISYDDILVENGMVGFQNCSKVNYDNIYQYDEFGKNYGIYSSYTNALYGANVFKRNENSREKLSEVGLYIYNDNTNVTIYLSNSEKNLNVNSLKSIATSSNLTSGYHVVKLDSPVYIEGTFAIIVKYENIDNNPYVPMEMNYSSVGSTSMQKYNQATSNPNESFFSLNGTDWVDLYGYKTLNGRVLKDTNVCIKVFTIDETENANKEEYIINDNWKVIKNTEENMLFGIEENTTIEELLSSNNFSSNYTVKVYKNGNEVKTGNATTGTTIRIFQNSNLIKEYTIVIYGDTNLDGKIASVDALTIIKNKLGNEQFKSKVSEEAGKVTSKTRMLNLTPSAVDALAIVKHKLGMEKVSQY